MKSNSIQSSAAAFAGKMKLPAQARAATRHAEGVSTAVKPSRVEQGSETPISRVHISLPVSDLQKSNLFYSKLFGQDASKEKSDYINFRLDQPAIHLALVHRESVPDRGCEHFGIELPDEETFKAWEKRLNETVAELAEPESGAKCCYAKADKVWLSDPDGNRWEIWHRTGDHSSL